ncbi:hypothetical protein Ae201684P_010573 [Aphanomyces euteiches]|uniref:WRKY19-like zinc finger domain-containing protein n=1 Tax=Aphanomyces euteiches TaxID=100861 RepID=A0A6G0WPD7_9STRA|nr:hypothetical protein Ae201684_013181 [Aphanomyces euteiches]KAH9076633.1 hypothetical protein Ae201684P_010573 [Aphanomyces euteiches]
MSTKSLCLFYGCTNVALMTGKCEAHKGRTRCMVDDCPNQTYARNLCIKHGGKQKCRIEGCESNVRSHGLCSKHGFGSYKKKLCEIEGCNKVAHARYRCVRHGGGQKCKVEDCTAFARSKGVCYRHGGVGRSASDSVSSSSSIQDEAAWTEQPVDDVWIGQFTALDVNNDIVFSLEERTMLEYFMPAKHIENTTAV